MKNNFPDKLGNPESLDKESNQSKALLIKSTY